MNAEMTCRPQVRHDRGSMTICFFKGSWVFFPVLIPQTVCYGEEETCGSTEKTSKQRLVATQYFPDVSCPSYSTDKTLTLKYANTSSRLKSWGLLGCLNEWHCRKYPWIQRWLPKFSDYFTQLDTTLRYFISKLHVMRIFSTGLAQWQELMVMLM